MRSHAPDRTRLACRLLARLHSSELGANLVEYAFLVALIAVVAVVAVRVLGSTTAAEVQSVVPAFEGP